MNEPNNNLPQVRDDLLIAEFGHELGNVLNGLLGMTQLVRCSSLTAEQDRWLDAIEQSGQQLRRLVDALRAVPRAQTGVWRANPRLVDGIELLEQAVLSHAPAARENDNCLLLTIEPDLPRSWNCDPRLLRQVLDNLLGNALKFTRSGEVVLEAAGRCNGAGAPANLVLSVIDSGPGIENRFGDHVFEAFQRADALGASRPDGQGLGLFICREIMRSLGGEITWFARPDGGTRFMADFPGMLLDSPAHVAMPARLLHCIDCSIDLQGSVRRSVTSTLSRLGVHWRLNDAAGVKTPSIAGPGRSVAASRVSIGEVAGARGNAGPQLELRAERSSGVTAGMRRLGLPAFESSLGPLLLELALEAQSVRNGKRG